MWPFCASPKSDKLTGAYRHGRKLMYCSFELKKLADGEECQVDMQTSGLVNWVFSAKKEPSEVLALSIKCLPTDSEVNEDWTLTADLIVSAVHPEEPKKNATFRFSAMKFSAEKAMRSTMKFEDFVDADGKIAFQVEIGVKRMEHLEEEEESKDFTKNWDEDLAVLLVDDVHFYVKKEKFSEIPCFKSKFAALTDDSEISIENATPETFHVLLKIVHSEPYRIQIEMVDELMRLGKEYGFKEISEKCADFLENAICDEALLIRAADKHGFQSVITKRLAAMKSVAEVAKGFKYYRYFSDATMRVLLKKFVEMA